MFDESLNKKFFPKNNLLLNQKFFLNFRKSSRKL